MSKARLIITAVVVEGRSKSEVARDYQVSRYWVQQLVRRYAAEGEVAFTPRSRAPHRSPQAVTPEGEEQIVRRRKELTKNGWDARPGPPPTPVPPLLQPNPPTPRPQPDHPDAGLHQPPQGHRHRPLPRPALRIRHDRVDTTG